MYSAVFKNNARTGMWHRQRGEELASAWLKQLLAYGCEEWDADEYLAADMAILSISP